MGMFGEGTRTGYGEEEREGEREGERREGEREEGEGGTTMQGEGKAKIRRSSRISLCG